MYLIINEDHTVEQTETLNPQLLQRCEHGKISIINCETMKGMNADFMEYGDWSDVPNYSGESDHILTHEGSETAQ